MGTNPSEYLDFDFSTGEVVEPVQYDTVDFMARIPGEWGVATINSWAKVPRGVQLSPRVRPAGRNFVLTVASYYLRRPWNGTQPPYIHESL